MSSSHLDLLIKGDLVLEESILTGGQVGVKDGVIVGLHGANEEIPAKESLDASGMLVFPGMVDAHVHSYSFPEEGFERSTPAAAAGGVTTIVEMPYDITGPQTDTEIFKRKIDLVKSMASVDVALLATIKKEGPLDMIAPLVQMGACGFKLSVMESDPVRFPRIADGVLWDALPIIAEQGVPVGFHAENQEIIESLIDRYRREGNTGPRAHCESRPPGSETTAVVNLLELAFWTKCRLHIFHASHPRTIHLSHLFKREGVDVTVETCPHYLILSEDDMARLGAYAKINPPLRTKEQVADMWDLVKRDMIDMITSDHAPWPRDKKESEIIFDNASGAPGVETIFPLSYSEGVAKRGLNPSQLARLLCVNPAKRFCLYPKKGHIALGADADFAILDPSATWTLAAEDLHMSSGWTPYEGIGVQGRIVKTILRGRTIYDGLNVTARPGDGAFVPGLRSDSEVKD
jgi:allantoinase